MKKNQSKYNLIADEMRERIFNQQYPLAQPIPDEMTLAAEFGSSRMTMKKALEVLVYEGLLYRKRGHGTFIIKAAVQNEKVNILSQELVGLTKTAKGKTVTSKVIEFNVEFPSEEVQEHLNIGKETPVYHLIRLRIVDGEPFVIEETYMPTNLIHSLTDEILANSIYAYIQDELKYTIASAHKEVRADRPSALDMEYLHCTEFDPVLEVRHVAYLNNGVPFEYSTSRHHFDKSLFKVVNIVR